MKLYTEEQVRKAIRDTRYFTSVESENDIINNMTPIELPSDEEIHKRATNYSSLYYEFRAGAKWVIEQIKNTQQ